MSSNYYANIAGDCRFMMGLFCIGLAIIIFPELSEIYRGLGLVILALPTAFGWTSVQLDSLNYVLTHDG